MLADYLKQFENSPFKKAILKNIRKPKKNRTVKYYKDRVEFVLRSKVAGIDLGRFRCSFYALNVNHICLEENLDNVEFTSIDYPHRYNPHPHIEDNIPCLGDFSFLMMESLKFGEIGELINLTQQFLNHESEDQFCSASDCLQYLKCGCFEECCCD